MKRYIRIEPRKQYDKAIVKEFKSGKLVYCYWKLIDITKKLYGGTKDDAAEWVDYNILGLNDSSESYFKVDYGWDKKTK